MQFIKETFREEKIYFYGSIYVILSLVAFGVINYFTWSPGVVTELSTVALLCWVSLYLPVIVFNKFAGWKVNEFGFVLNKRVGLVMVISLLLGAWLYVREPEIRMFDQWHYSLIEAFARVGEEAYFRGFIYVLALRLFKTQKKPHLWAIMLSSVAFTVMHTQSFLPENGSPILQILLLALFLAYLRHTTGSLLPSITIHCLLKGNLLGILFGWAIYALFVIWAYVERSLEKRQWNTA